MGTIAIQKVLVLPSTFTPNAIYMLQDPTNPDFAIFYVASNDGTTIRRLPTLADIDAALANNPYAPTAPDNMFIVNNISGLSTLNPTVPSIAWVLDTTGDATANGYAAPYMYIPGTNGAAGTWNNMYNANYTVHATWAEITGGPTATPSDIDSVTNWWMTYGMYYFNG